MQSPLLMETGSSEVREDQNEDNMIQVYEDVLTPHKPADPSDLTGTYRHLPLYKGLFSQSYKQMAQINGAVITVCSIRDFFSQYSSDYVAAVVSKSFHSTSVLLI